MNDRYPIVKMLDGSGMGVIVNLGTHYATVEFQAAGHKWHILVEHDDYEVVGYINHKEI